jgi:hypothetical protein
MRVQSGKKEERGSAMERENNEMKKERRGRTDFCSVSLCKS